MKLVSVIIPTYKRPSFLKRAIDSVLNQTYPNIEVIVVDDNNPTDKYRAKTEEVMENYTDNDSVYYIKHNKNKNGSAARNTGIRKSNGEYIAFLDNDDEFSSEKIYKQVRKLESKDDSWGVCYTSYIRKENGKVIGKSTDSQEGYLYLDVLKGHLYLSAGSNMLIKREVIDEIGYFDESFLRRQDLEFLIRASSRFKVAHVPDPLLIIHKDDRSNSEQYDFNFYMENVDHFLDKFEYLIKNENKQDQVKIVKAQYLILLRTLYLKGKFCEAHKLRKEYKISLTLMIRFIFYSVWRKISGQIYGFKI